MIRQGSIIQSLDGSFWYACGDWTIDNIAECVPCILSYMVQSDKIRARPQQKELSIGEHTLIKVFGQPLEVYRDFLTTLSFIPRRMGNNYGKVVHLPICEIRDIRDPKTATERFLDSSSPYSGHLTEIMAILKLPMGSVGVSGSALMLPFVQLRHELDFCIFDMALAKEAHRLILANRTSGVFSRDSLGAFHLPFRYKGLWFDPQFGYNDEQRNHVDGCCLMATGQYRDLNVVVTDASHGIFFPSFITTDIGVNLLSFRPGHRGLFRNGDRLFIPHATSARLIRSSGESEDIILIDEDQRIDIQTRPQDNS